MRKRTPVISQLAEHPNLAEVLGVLAQLTLVRDAELPLLASAWSNGAAVASARTRALGPDSPLVLDVLSAFDSLAEVFGDDLRGEATFLTVDRLTTTTALKAVRDAIAAAYAQPMLTVTEHGMLLAPWRSVYPIGTVEEPDLGPRAEHVKALLAALPQLSQRCHDTDGQVLYDRLVDRSFAHESDRAVARATAFSAAVLTSRRRTWALLRRSGAEGLCRPCTSCRRAVRDEREVQRVLTVCLDAVCALLVADALPDSSLALLVDPVAALIPDQRDAST